MQKLQDLQKINKWQAWLLATRPKTLTLSIAPVLVGTLLAYTQVPINWNIALFALLVALCIQIGTNLINDALDFKKGADTSSRLGPMRVTQSGLIPMKHVYIGGIAAFALALLFGLPLVIHGGWPIAVLLAISVICGYAYTGGPKPLAYHGLGEIFVLLFFGWAGTCVSYALQTGFIEAKVSLAGTQIGLFAMLPIAINNLRDNRDDAKVNKRTLAVRFGRVFALYEISVFAFLPFGLNIFWFFIDLKLAAMLPLLTLPLANGLVRGIWNAEQGSTYLPYFAKSVILQLVFCTLLCIGILLS